VAADARGVGLIDLAEAIAERLAVVFTKSSRYRVWQGGEILAPRARLSRFPTLWRRRMQSRRLLIMSR